MIKNYEIYFDNIRDALSINDMKGLYNSTIAVFGANGMIGSCIVDTLMYLNKIENANIKIICMIYGSDTAFERYTDDKNVVIVQQDVMKEISYDENIDFLINAASNSHPKMFSEKPVETMDINYIGMRNILNYGLKHKCKKVLYISSGEIYGQASENVKEFTEEYRGYINYNTARSCYPVSKIATETLCSAFCSEYGMENVIVRPCHTYGPTQTETDSRASSSFIRDAVGSNDIIMKSKGEQIRSYCYVVDCAIGILIALLNGKNNEAYNVSNNNAIVSIREFAEIVAENTNVSIVYELPNQKEVNGFNTVTRSVLSGAKLEGIGWKPYFGIKDGISNTIKIMR